VTGRARSMMALLGLAFAGMLGLSAPAKADLRVCNTTSGRVGVAIGYLDGPVWVTEGWFNLKPGRCETIIRGQLNSRFFYLHAGSSRSIPGNKATGRWNWGMAGSSRAGPEALRPSPVSALPCWPFICLGRT
jgi:uncharacterized membrane protein